MTNRPPRTRRPALLSGGNPQIAKADGDAPVQSYIAAMPEWKRAVGNDLDALITRHVPDVRKAVKWNSPFYGIEGRGWFLSFHVFTRYVKVTFFNGRSLRPMPPGTSTHKDVRYLDIYEHDELDERQLVSWLKQAAALPGWDPSAPRDTPQKKTDWREVMLDRVRALIVAAVPDMIEERKWKKPSNPGGVPVWSHHGIVCTGEKYKNVVKLTFARGASLPDPSHLFNASLEGSTRRAIDIPEGGELDARAFKALVKAAAVENARAKKKKR